jgi:hypothetical protein
VVASPNAILSLVTPDLAPQKVPFPIQDEHGDAMEDGECHKGLRWCYKVDACTNSYVTKWLFHQHLERTHSFRMQVEKSKRPSTRPGGLSNKI